MERRRPRHVAGMPRDAAGASGIRAMLLARLSYSPAGERPIWIGVENALVRSAAARQLLDQLADDRLGVAEQRPGLVGVVQLVVDAGEAGVLAALDGDDGAGLVGV